MLDIEDILIDIEMDTYSKDFDDIDLYGYNSILHNDDEEYQSDIVLE